MFKLAIGLLFKLGINLLFKLGMENRPNQNTKKGSLAIFPAGWAWGYPSFLLVAPQTISHDFRNLYNFFLRIP